MGHQRKGVKDRAPTPNTCTTPIRTSQPLSTPAVATGPPTRLEGIPWTHRTGPRTRNTSPRNHAAQAEWAYTMRMHIRPCSTVCLPKLCPGDNLPLRHPTRTRTHPSPTPHPSPTLCRDSPLKFLDSCFGLALNFRLLGDPVQLH